MVALVLYQFFYHPPTYSQLHVQGKTKGQQMKELDYGGIFLFTAGMVLFLIGLSWGGTVYPWVSAEVLCTLLIGIVCFIALGFYGTLLILASLNGLRLTKTHRILFCQAQCTDPTTSIQIR